MPGRPDTSADGGRTGAGCGAAEPEQAAARPGPWSIPCDRHAKATARPFEHVLGRLEALPVYEYTPKADGAAPARIDRGPMAQDWHHLFPAPGKDPLAVDTLDLAAVALAAIKELAAQVRTLEAEVAFLRDFVRVTQNGARPAVERLPGLVNMPAPPPAPPQPQAAHGPAGAGRAFLATVDPGWLNVADLRRAVGTPAPPPHGGQ